MIVGHITFYGNGFLTIFSLRFQRFSGVMTYITAKPKSKFQIRNTCVVGGLLNNEALSFKEMAGGKKTLMAFCQTCAAKYANNRMVSYVRGLSDVASPKDVARNAVWCPDCGKALFWSREYSEPVTWGDAFFHGKARADLKMHMFAELKALKDRKSGKA